MTAMTTVIMTIDEGAMTVANEVEAEKEVRAAGGGTKGTVKAETGRGTEKIRRRTRRRKTKSAVRGH